MQARSEVKKQEKKARTGGFKKFAILCLFFVFTLVVIYAVDISTGRIMMIRDDRRAIGLSLTDADNLKLELAGEKYDIRTEPAVRAVRSALKYIKDALDR